MMGGGGTPEKFAAGGCSTAQQGDLGSKVCSVPCASSTVNRCKYLGVCF